MRNYHLLRNDRPTRGGGVAILINKQIKFNNITKKTTRDYEYITIDIFNNNDKMTVASVYTHPKSKTNYNFLKKIRKNITLKESDALNKTSKQNSQNDTAQKTI